MRKYVILITTQIKEGLQYRVALFGSILVQALWALLMILIYSKFFEISSRSLDITFSQTVSYIWLSQIFLAFYMSWFLDHRIFLQIQNGDVSYIFIRPVEIYDLWYFQSMAKRVARVAVQCIPILLIAMFIPEPYNLKLPYNYSTCLIFILSLFLSLGVVVAFNMYMYITSFYTISATGVRMIAGIMSDFLMGAMIPLPFFPESIRKIVELLPFASMQNTPFRIYSGNIQGIDALKQVLLQMFWLVFLVLTGKYLMKRAARKVIIQGG